MYIYIYTHTYVYIALGSSLCDADGCPERAPAKIDSRSGTHRGFRGIGSTPYRRLKGAYEKWSLAPRRNLRRCRRRPRFRLGGTTYLTLLV